MERTISAVVAAAFLLIPVSCLATTKPKVAPLKLSRDYPVKPVPFAAVHLTDQFWAPKIELNRKVTIPYAFQKCEETGRVRNFINAAKTLQGDKSPKPLPGYPFDDTDIYKVIEGASYSLSVHPDPKLDAYVDSLISKIAAAQEPDGYLYTARTINPAHPHEWSGATRWVNEEDQSHELYCAGHMYEAAAAHYLATGKRNFLNIAIKNANLLCNTFGPGKKTVWPGHEIVEMGLAKLYRVTGDARYLALSKFFLDSRGQDRNPQHEYWQAQEPVVDQTEAVGHAVRASYLYSGMADVAALTGDEAYLNAIDKIWQNVVDDKLYVTGGIGAVGGGEAFGPDYFLPNMSAYCETCAAVGNDFWNQRLFLLHGEAKYVDVFERTLYNGLISGVGLNGNTFFYPNPLESRGQNERSPWFGVACCPGNITRFLPSVPGYFYAEKGSALYVNLFATGTADVRLDNGRKVNVAQQTKYPWSGAVHFVLKPDRASSFTVNVRIPDWARNQPVPSNLYRFLDSVNEPVTLKVDGRAVPVRLDKGYAVLTRHWKSGDTIDLNLPMPVRRIVANSSVKADQGRVALQRGPIVYCAEWPDNPGGKVRNLMLPDQAQFTAEFKPALLDGVTVIESTAEALSMTAEGQVSKKQEPLTMIPYYSWANRGRGEMIVWIPDTEASAHPSPYPTIFSTAAVTTSPGRNKSAINDLHEATSSADESSFFHWWPKKGTQEWVEYRLKAPATVSETQLYWFDDTGTGECRVPQSWKVFYWADNAWKPVETTDAYGVAKDAYNTVKFNPVTADRFRLEVQLQPNWSAGIQQWRLK